MADNTALDIPNSAASSSASANIPILNNQSFTISTQLPIQAAQEKSILIKSNTPLTVASLSTWKGYVKFMHCKQGWKCSAKANR
jgi:hypothetical protein